jgi:hypothetical protein
LLVRLDCERQALRRQLLKSFGRYVNGYFGVALIVLAISMMPLPLVPVTLPIFGVVSGFLFILGLLLVLTIIMLPLGLFIL